MKYEYKGMKLEDSIETIVDKMTKDNTIFDRATKALIYRPFEYIYVYIYLINGKILLIKVFDKEHQMDEFLKVGKKISNELIEKYDLYFDDFEEVYLSKKYKELVVIVDLYDNIVGFSFDKQEEIDIFKEDRILNYLECKNFQDIYVSLRRRGNIEIALEKREIYGQLDNYKFTFDLVTRDLKNIQNLETGELVK